MGTAVNRAILVAAVAAVIAVAFAVMVLTNAFLDPLCCADDAYIANASKNLAAGYGYASSVSMNHVQRFTLFAFDPAISTGLPIVLAGAFVRLFTDALWAASLGAVLVNFTLLALIWWQLPAQSRNTVMAGFLAALFAIYSFNWGQLNLPLGEFPAALFICLGALLLDRASETGRWHVAGLAGACLGAAILTKTLALLGVGALLIYFAAFSAVSLWRTRRMDRADIILGIAAAVAFALPALFELVKITTLGWSGYMDLLAVQRDLMATISPSFAPSQWRPRNELFYDWLGLPLVAVLIAGAALVVRQQGNVLRPSAPVAMLFTATLFGTWFLLSDSQQFRYVLIASFVGLFGLCTVAGAQQFSARTAGVAAAFALYIVAFNLPDIEYNINNTMRIARDNPRARELAQVAAILDAPAYAADRPIVTSIWASAADIQYALKTHADFEPQFYAGLDRSRRRLVAYRKQFVVAGFPDLLEDCEVLYDGASYWAGICTIAPPAD